MATTSTSPRRPQGQQVHRPGCRYQSLSTPSRSDMSYSKPECNCSTANDRPASPDVGSRLKLDLGIDFDSSFSLDFDFAKFDFDGGLGSLSAPAPAPAPVTETRSADLTPCTAAASTSASPSASASASLNPRPSISMSTSQEFTPPTPPSARMDTLARSPSLPSLSTSPVSPITPTPILATPTTPVGVRATSPPTTLKSALSTSSSRSSSSTSSTPAPTRTPPPSVTFALPSPGILRLPVVASDDRASQPKRRVQVGAFGEVSWVTEPPRHTQVEARNPTPDTSYTQRSGAGARPSGWMAGRTGRVALQPLNSAASSLSPHHRSLSWNSGQQQLSAARRRPPQHDESKDWLIAYHVQQLTAERERKLAKLAKQQKPKDSRERVLAPSPLSRDVGRTPSRLPSITEEASRPPRTTSLRALPSTEPARSSSLNALTTGLKRPISEPNPTVPRQSMDSIRKSETEDRDERLAEDNRSYTPTRAAPVPPGPTSPLAQEPITRVVSPPSSPTITRRASTPDPDSSPSSLGRRESLLNLTLRRAARPLKLDFGFKAKGKHSRSNSQSSKTSDQSESSESSEDSFGTVETNDTVELIRTPTSPVPPAVSASAGSSTTPISRGSASSFSSFKALAHLDDAEGSTPSLKSFTTCKSTMSAETLTLRTSSSVPSSGGPQTPRSSTPTTVPSTPADAPGQSTPETPGTPESEVIATPTTDVSVRPWQKGEKGAEERVESSARIVAAF